MDGWMKAGMDEMMAFNIDRFLSFTKHSDHGLAWVCLLVCLLLFVITGIPKRGLVSTGVWELSMVRGMVN